MATNLGDFEALRDRLMNMCRSGDVAVDAVRLDQIAHSVLTEQDNVEGVKKQMWYRIKGRSQADDNRLRLIEVYRTWPKETELELERCAVYWSDNPQYFWTLAGTMTEVIGQSQEAHEHILRCWRASNVLNDAP